jgi:hypothetical protein
MQGPRQPPYVELTDQPLPFGESPPYNPRYGAPQEAQIGGGERQLGLPFEQPAAPAARGQRALPPVEAPVVDAQGQYGFNIEAPHGVGVPRTFYEDGKFVTEQSSRSAMPDTGGVAKEATPPSPGDQPPNAARYAKDVPAAEGTPGSGINVLQPGQVDPTLRGGLQIRPREAPVTEPAAPTRFGGQFKQEPPRAAPEPAAGPPRVATPELDAAVARATAPEPPAAAAARQGVPFMLTQKMKVDLAARGHTPEQIRSITPTQAREILSKPAAQPARVKNLGDQLKERAAAERAARATPAEPTAPAADDLDLTIPPFLRKPQALSRQEADIRRQDVVRGRSGRPIETRRLPIGL